MGACTVTRRAPALKQEVITERRNKPLIIAIPKIGNLPAMARPVFLWIGAVKEKRPDLLAQAFSSSARKELEGMSWTEVLRRYDELWREKFGSWRVEDFHFVGSLRSGDQPNRGIVIVAYKPPGAKVAKRTQVPVVREGENWYVDRTFLKKRSTVGSTVP